MEFAELVFGLVAPIMVIIFATRKANPINERYLKHQAERAIEETVISDWDDACQQEVVEVIQLTSEGVAAVSALLPSIISVTLSGIITIREFKPNFWLAFWLAFFFVVFVIVVATRLYVMVSQRSAYRLAVALVSNEPDDGKQATHRPYPYTELLRRWVVRLNIGLCVFVLFTFVYTQ